MSEQTNNPLMLTNPKEIEFKDNVGKSVEIIQRELRNKKFDIFKMRLKELGKLNLLKNMKNRFPPIMVEITPDGTEKYYINNNTRNGQLVLTIYTANPNIEGSEFSTKLYYK